MKTTLAVIVTLLLLVGGYMLWQGRAESTIQVTTASHGMNVAANLENNYTNLVRARCDGQVRCNFSEIGSQGDPAPGRSKDFRWTWACSGQNGTKNGQLPPEAVGKTAELYCPF